MRDIIKYDKIIIGSSLAALSYSFINQIPILINDKSIHFSFWFEYFDSDVDFKQLNIFYTNVIKKSNNGNNIEQGLCKIILYNYLNLVSSLMGLAPFSECFEQININKDKKIIEIVTTDNVYRIEYKTLYIFEVSDNIIWDIKPLKEEEKLFLVIDWINLFKSFEELKYDYYFDKEENNFVKKIIIYNKKYTKKFAFFISILTKEQISDTNYSDFFVRRKAERMIMEEKVKFQNPSDRIILPIYNSCYQNSNDIIFLKFDVNLFWKKSLQNIELFKNNQNFQLFLNIAKRNKKQYVNKEIISFSRYYSSRAKSYYKREKKKRN